MKIILIILITSIIHEQNMLTMEHPMGPTFISTIRTKQKLYYNTLGVRLDCSARGNPLPTISWFRMGTMENRLLISVQPSDLIDLYKNGSLYIRPFREYVKAIHAGSFICRAENPGGSIQSIPIRLKPQIYDAYDIDVKNPYGFVQSSVIISCEISPLIASSYVTIIGWLEKVDDQIIRLDLQAKTKYNLLPNENLIIHNLTKSDDHRSYACIIRNQIDQNTKQSRFKTLRVRDRSPFGLELSVPNNTEYHVRSGELIELPCGIASISTQTKISWRKDGIELKDIQTRIYQNSLMFQPSADDAGIYTCQVEDESTGRMTSILSLTVNIPIKCQLYLQQTNISIGTNSDLFCTSSTLLTSPIQWQWYHNSLLLPSKSNRYSISNATRKHMGMYQCCYTPSSSEFNGCCAQTQIRVINSPPFILPLEQTHSHSIIISPKSISIDLNCTVYGDPIPDMHIYKDGQRLLINNLIEHLSSGDVFLHYSISISNVRDTGLYECRAKNSFGSISLSKHINIENQKPFIQPLINRTIRVNEEFTLECYASGQPNLHLQWIDQATDQILNTSFTSPILFTSKTTKSNVYICQARNPYGEISSRIFLRTEIPARILSITPNQTIQINERLDISCLAEGDNPVEMLFKSPSKYSNEKNISMMIEKIQMTDSGLYECYVKNNYSEDRAVFEIIVQNRPEKIEKIFLETTERIHWAKPFDGNSRILKYILRIEYRQSEASDSDATWSRETIITIDKNELTSYSFEKIFSKCMISVSIQAVNSIGSSEPSDPLHFQTNTKQLPIPPYNLTAVNVSSRSVILAWQYPSFYICHGSTLEFVIEIIDSNNQTTTQLHHHPLKIATIHLLKSFTRYTFVIYAVNDFGASPKSDLLKIQTTESVPLAMVADLTGRLLNSSTASITWTFPENHSELLNGRFRSFALAIYENFNMSTLTTIEVVNTNLILSNLHPSSSYFISVSICNHFDCGSSSSAITIRTFSSIFDTYTPVIHPTHKPTSIQGKIHYITSNEIGLKILYPPEVIERLIITYKISNTSSIDRLNISPPVFNIRLTNLSCGNTYEIMLNVSNREGVSPTEYFITKTEGSAPSLIDSSALFETISTDYIILNMKHWSIDICPIQSYEIELFPANNTSEIPFSRYLSSKDSFRIDHLQSNKDYRLHIQIYSEAGETLRKLSFRTIADTSIPNDQMIFIMIGITSIFLTLVFVLIILRSMRTDKRARQKKVDIRNPKLKLALYSNKTHRSLQKTEGKNRADSFASEDSQGNINPYAVTDYTFNHHDELGYQTLWKDNNNTNPHLAILPPERYFCPMIVQPSVSSSADSGVHSSYAQSPRFPPHPIDRITEDHSNLRHEQYSLV